MPAPQLPAFDPHDVAQSNATSYPEPYRAANLHRYNRRLGDHVGLQNYGVVMTRIVPGGQSSHRHAHSRQDEFIYVLEGEVTLETNSGQQILSAGMCAGFPAGTVLLVVGDRTANDEVSYPDIDMHLEPLPDGTRRFTRKDGTPY
jgi:uncharacterized cupin superfamily protein